MTEIVFNTKLLPDGHLYCPEEFAGKKDVQFKVIVVFDETAQQAIEQGIEASAVQDVSENLLSEEELNYYLNLVEIGMPAEPDEFRLPKGVNERLQDLLDRQDQGDGLTPAEQMEAEGLVNLAELLSLLRLRVQRIAQEGAHGR